MWIWQQLAAGLPARSRLRVHKWAGVLRAGDHWRLDADQCCGTQALVRCWEFLVSDRVGEASPETSAADLRAPRAHLSFANGKVAERQTAMVVFFEIAINSISIFI